MQAIIRITKHGRSLDLIVTREVKELGLDYGDYVKVTIEPALVVEKKSAKVTKVTTIPKITTNDLPRTDEQRAYFAHNTEDVHHDRPANNDDNDKFDPTRIGDLVIKAIGDTEFSDPELIDLISKYDGNKEHVTKVLGYIKEKRT